MNEQINSTRKTPDESSIEQVILENTQVASAPLVPEIQVHLLRDDSPLWRSFADEPDARGLPRPYWAFAWGGGQALARYVLDHPKVVEGKCILDFGAGCGLASIASIKAGAARVTASDIDPISIRAIGYNATQNNVKVETVCLDLIYSENQGWDVILAGDIWYDTRLARHGMSWLRSLAAEGLLVLSGDPGRAYSTSQGMEVLADYSCRSVPDLEHPNLQKVFINRVLPKA